MYRVLYVATFLLASVWPLSSRAAATVFYAEIDRLVSHSLYPNDFGLGSALTFSFEQDLSGTPSSITWSMQVGTSSVAGIGTLLYDPELQAYEITFDSSQSINWVHGGTFNYVLDDQQQTLSSSWVIAEYGSFSTASSRFTVGFQHIDTQSFFEIGGTLSTVAQGPIPEPGVFTVVAVGVLALAKRRKAR